MSQVPIWMEAVDGLMYKEPVFEGTFEDVAYFVVFDDDDDDDPAEIVVADPDAKSPFAARVLKRIGFDFKPESFCRRGSSTRDFSTRGKKTDLRRSASFFFEVAGPIPVPDKQDHKLSMDDFDNRSAKQRECAYVRFSKKKKTRRSKK